MSASIQSAETQIPETVLNGEPVVLAGRVEIFPQSPLPELDTPAGPAYAARIKGESKANLYAIICSAGLPWRYDILSSLHNINHPNMARFRDSGQVEWPGGTLAGAMAARHHGLVYERPAGLPIGSAYAAGQPHQAPMEVEKLVSILLRPLIDMVGDLSSAGISHGNLNLNNLYMSAGGVIQAGDCVSCPPSFQMPAMYLTIERAQAMPAGRGTPRIGDDLYALAVATLIMSMGFNPVAHLSDDELLRRRIERGTLQAFVGDHHLKGNSIELFRNLLEDDPRRRWDLSDMDVWLEGRRPTSKLIEGEMKPKRAFSVGDDSSQTRRGVAQLLTQNPLKAAVAVESGELQRWIERSIEIESLSKRAKILFDRAQSNQRSPNSMPQLVSKIAAMIDPYAPMRYKETSVLPSGFGSLLATRMTTGADIQPLVEMLQAELPTLWADNQNDHRADHIATQQLLERAGVYIERKVIGYGVERALYELVPSQACLSPLIRHANAQSVPQALRALDRMGENAGMQVPMDRHLAAFFIARDRRIQESLLATLNSSDNSIKRIIGILSLLADAQYRHNMQDLKGLAQWMARLLEPATKRFFEKAMQEKAKRELQQAATKGDLIDLVNLLDSPDALENDRVNFEDARVIWRQAEEDIETLQLDIDNREDVERRVGQPLASGLAVVLGIVAMGFVIVMALGGTYL